MLGLSGYLSFGIGTSLILTSTTAGIDIGLGDWRGSCREGENSLALLAGEGLCLGIALLTGGGVCAEPATAANVRAVAGADRKSDV